MMNLSNVAGPTTRHVVQHLEMWMQHHQALGTMIDEVQTVLTRNNPPVQDLTSYLDAKMGELTTSHQMLYNAYMNLPERMKSNSGNEYSKMCDKFNTCVANIENFRQRYLQNISATSNNILNQNIDAQIPPVQNFNQNAYGNYAIYPAQFAFGYAQAQQLNAGNFIPPMYTIPPPVYAFPGVQQNFGMNGATIHEIPSSSSSSSNSGPLPRNLHNQYIGNQGHMNAHASTQNQYFAPSTRPQNLNPPPGYAQGATQNQHQANFANNASRPDFLNQNIPPQPSPIPNANPSGHFNPSSSSSIQEEGGNPILHPNKPGPSKTGAFRKENPNCNMMNGLATNENSKIDSLITAMAEMQVSNNRLLQNMHQRIDTGNDHHQLQLALGEISKTQQFMSLAQYLLTGLYF